MSVPLTGTSSVSAGASRVPLQSRPTVPVSAVSADTVLAVLRPGFADGANPDFFKAPLTVLHAEGEVERRPEAHVCWQWDARLGMAVAGDVAALQLELPETGTEALEEVSYRAYLRLKAELQARGYCHLWRIWNYVGDITEGEGDEERYRRFCLGRHRALADGVGFEMQLPAATAVGRRGRGLHLLALAGREAGIQVENPQQLSAFRYPREYGPRSPSFSRATLLPWLDTPLLLVSGTASIVGHATVHAGDLRAQFEQTVRNLAVLCARAETLLASTQGLHAILRPSSLTIYLRHPQQLALLLPLISAHFRNVPFSVLQADICRRELLVEIDGIYVARPVLP